MYLFFFLVLTPPPLFPASVRLSDPSEVARVLFEDYRLKSREHGTTDAELERLLDDLPVPQPGRPPHPAIKFIELVLQHRGAQTFLRSCESLRVRVVVLSNSATRIHGHWKQTATGTGRVTCVVPALQTVPKRKIIVVGTDTRESLRAIVRAEESMVLASLDYSQLELRILAHLSQSSSLKSAFEDVQIDVFTELAAMWKGEPVTQVHEEDRSRMKRIVYAVIYGMGARSLSELLHTSPDRAATFLGTFLDTFGLRDFIASLTKGVRDDPTHCVRTLLGRPRPLVDISSKHPQHRRRAERQVLSTLVQGTAADIVKQAMRSCHELLENTPTCHSTAHRRSRLIANLHDELLFEVCSGCAEELVPRLATAMESAVKFDVPMSVRVGVGKSWGTLFQLDEPQTLLVSMREQHWAVKVESWLAKNPERRSKVPVDGSRAPVQRKKNPENASERRGTKRPPSKAASDFFAPAQQRPKSTTRSIVGRLSESDEDSLSEVEAASDAEALLTQQVDAVYSAARERHAEGTAFVRLAARGNLTRGPLDQFVVRGAGSGVEREASSDVDTGTVANPIDLDADAALLEALQQS
jgi:DNA polymerase family A